MNHSYLFSMLALICAPAAFAGCGLLAFVANRARRTATQSLEITAELAERLAAAERKSEEITHLRADQACRIAWLESRVRQGKHNSGPTTGSDLKAPSRTSMTERRHRVLSLARRGLDSISIAGTLGVPYGEVELIMSLSVSA
jgi:DNA-binding NarL/FixJ family response regulator